MLKSARIDNYGQIWSNMVMSKVNTAELKARLSEYLHRVREGEEITVYDRKTAIAKIVPLVKQASSKLVMTPPKPGMPAFSMAKLKGIPFRNTNSLKDLREDRDKR